MSDYRFFSNKECEYYPCHEIEDGEEINCLFCYCPLYALKDRCGGNFSYTESGIKSCKNCIKPHKRDGYDHIMSHIREVTELSNREDSDTLHDACAEIE